MNLAALLHRLANWGHCDACDRFRPLRFSPDHGANFDGRCYAANNQQEPDLPHMV